ncbi:hypothetical protein ACSNOH_01130 [Streptomyces sp. URMC 127]|uniref:hypothetical protein n=1 Tax=Streptomyces sp. URMC 127 TaxID=3423402 RepID=UPI003F1A962B
MDTTRWVETGVHGLQARHGEDGSVYTRTAGGERTIDVASLQQLAQGVGPGTAGDSPWTPDLARAVLHSLGIV